MTEQQIRDFGTHARGQVPLTDWDELEQRAGRRSLRHRVLIAAATACVLGLAGYLAVPGRVPTLDLPARQPDKSVSTDLAGGFATYPVQPDKTEPGLLTSGTYDLLVSYEPFAPLARFTVPAGWTAANTPTRSGDGWEATFLVGDIAAVTTTPCRVVDTGMQAIGTDPKVLVDALSGLPGYRLAVAPEADTRFGVPVTHLRLVELAGNHCPHGGQYQIFKTETTGLYHASGKASTVLDVWVGTAEGHTVTVIWIVEPGTPTSVRMELGAIAESLDFVME